MTKVVITPDSAAAKLVPTSDDTIVFVDGKTLVTAEDEFLKYAQGITSLESDLLRISSAIFAADRAVARGEGQDLARVIQLEIPIVNVARLLPLRSVLEDLLYRLSQDAWTISFQQISGAPESTAPIPKEKRSGTTLLFSGGADSLAAALEFGKTNALQLVSHKTHNAVTDRAQRDLVDYLNAHGYDLPHMQFLVSSRSAPSNPARHDEEESQRTRSFVFLTLGSLAARRSGDTKVVFLAENGQMAIHLPLTQGRIGALSTHTAHPDVLRVAEALLSRALDYSFSITNPYVYQTKAEVVNRILTTLPDTLWLSNSCWRNSRLAKGTHCGSCIPCFVRRIAIERHGKDQTVYARDAWIDDLRAAGPDDLARRNMADFGDFITRFRTFSDEEVFSEWPELYSDAMDATQVISMYRRFAIEADAVLSQYPLMQPFLQ
jgi:7-cyano-7-deazaguanine synthase in queuosine biosynthesis